MHETNTEAHKQYQCRHIFTDGRRCASPCLRQEEFCYYHHTNRKPVVHPRRRRSRRSTFRLPLPEDRSAIQSSIGEVLQRIASNEIDPRRAGLLLYGLQIASLNLGKSQPATKTSTERESETIEEITIDPTLGVLAPRTELSTTTTRKSVVAQLIEKMIRSEREEAASAGANVLPALQATYCPRPWALSPLCPQSASNSFSRILSGRQQPGASRYRASARISPSGRSGNLPFGREHGELFAQARVWLGNRLR